MGYVYKEAFLRLTKSFLQKLLYFIPHIFLMMHINSICLTRSIISLHGHVISHILLYVKIQLTNFKSMSVDESYDLFFQEEMRYALFSIF